MALPTPSGADKSLLPTAICPDLTPLAGLASWIANPLPQVGTTTAPLTNVPTGNDYASRTGCKSQSYTSWDSSSRSFVVQVVYDGVQEINRDRAHLEADYNRPNLIPDEPGVMDRATWTATDLRMYQSGRKLFFRGVGLITPKQLGSPQYRERVLVRRSFLNTCFQTILNRLLSPGVEPWM